MPEDTKKPIMDYVVIAFSGLIIITSVISMVNDLSGNPHNSIDYYNGVTVTFLGSDQADKSIEILPLVLSAILISGLSFFLFYFIKREKKKSKILGIITYCFFLIIAIIKVNLILILVFLLIIGYLIGNKKSEQSEQSS